MLNKSYSYGRQYIDDDDINEVIKILHSDWLTQGPIIKQFENSLCKKFGAQYTSVVSSGTAALHLTGLALNWNESDVVITSPITFAASANCILYSNAIPDFADIDPLTYTIDPNKLEEKIKSYNKINRKVKAVIAVDYAGHPCDWQALKSIKDKYGIQLVNDNCHSLGAEYKGDATYAVKYADAVIQSYHPVKHITTGEGGAVLTNNKEFDEKIKILRTHGISNNDSLMGKNEGPWYYEMMFLGFNYRITDFQCALGLNQLKKLDSFLLKRRRIAEFYNHELDECENILLPSSKPEIKHAYHLYPVQINFDQTKYSRKEFFGLMLKRNIKLQVHYIPVHLHPYYRKNFGFKPGDFPEAEKFYSREISLPIYFSLEDEDLNYIVKNMKEFLS